MEMYNPFVPGSRTTTLPPPPPPKEVLYILESWVSLLFLIPLILFLVSAALCIMYRKQMPWYHGRSMSLPSIEFDVDEVLAALEREKSMGTRESCPPNRVNIDDDDEEEIVILDKGGPPVSSFIPKSQRLIPNKPRRIREESSSKGRRKRKDRDIQNEARVIDETDCESRSYSRLNEPEEEIENIYMNIDHDMSISNAKTGTGQTNDVDKQEKAEDALDKIKRSNFPKVLPDFPFCGMEFEGNSTHEKRIVPISPTNTRKTITAPSPPKVPVVFTPRKERNRNSVPNFLEFHSHWPESSRASDVHDLVKSKEKKGRAGKNNKKNAKKKTDGKKTSKSSLTENVLPQNSPNVDMETPTMETFNSNIYKQKSISKESGIYFAEPVNVISDVSVSNSPEITEEINNDEEEASQEIANVISNSIMPLISAFDAKSAPSSKNENIKSSYKIPAKLSKARQDFRRKLEKVLQKPVLSSKNDSFQRREISNLMREEAANQTRKERMEDNDQERKHGRHTSDRVPTEDFIDELKLSILQENMNDLLEYSRNEQSGDVRNTNTSENRAVEESLGDGPHSPIDLSEIRGLRNMGNEQRRGTSSTIESTPGPQNQKQPSITSGEENLSEKEEVLTDDQQALNDSENKNDDLAVKMVENSPPSEGSSYTKRNSLICSQDIQKENGANGQAYVVQECDPESPGQKSEEEADQTVSDEKNKDSPDQEFIATEEEKSQPTTRDSNDSLSALGEKVSSSQEDTIQEKQKSSSADTVDSLQVLVGQGINSDEVNNSSRESKFESHDEKCGSPVENVEPLLNELVSSPSGTIIKKEPFSPNSPEQLAESVRMLEGPRTLLEADNSQNISEETGKLEDDIRRREPKESSSPDLEGRHSPNVQDKACEDKKDTSIEKQKRSASLDETKRNLPEDIFRVKSLNGHR